MNNLNIPIYRAKKIDSDEYVIGNLIEDEGVFYIIKNPVVTHFNGLQQLTGECEYLDRVDPTILAINLPDMLDSKGNKIFASLSEDGKGGDKMLKGVDMEQYGLKNTYYTAICTRGSVLLKELYESTSISCTAHGFLTELKVIGIQK